MARCTADLIAWLKLLRDAGVKKATVKRTDLWLAEFVIEPDAEPVSIEAKVAVAQLIGSLRLEWRRHA